MKKKCRTGQFVGASGPRQTFLITVADSEKNITEVTAVEWATPLSVRPPLFGIVISPNKRTYTLIKKTGVFTVNVPSIDILKQTWWAGSNTGSQNKDKIAESGLTLREGKTNTNAVSIDEANASFECKVVNEIAIGNYVLFIGEVQFLDVREELFDTERGMWDPSKLKSIYRVAYDSFVTNKNKTLPLK
jgi:flavin reductase (DIM6/NTAB) family NADH-FMN oxidoreductase RutF